MPEAERKKLLQAVINDPRSTPEERREAERMLNGGEQQPPGFEAISDPVIEELESRLDYMYRRSHPKGSPAVEQLHCDLGLWLSDFPGYDSLGAIDRLTALYQAAKSPKLREMAISTLKSLTHCTRPPEVQAKAERVLADLGVAEPTVCAVADETHESPEPSAGLPAPHPVPTQAEGEAAANDSHADGPAPTPEAKIEAPTNVARRPRLNIDRSGLPDADTLAALNKFFRCAQRGDRVGKCLLDSYDQKSADVSVSIYAAWLNQLLIWCRTTGLDVQHLPGESSAPKPEAEGGPEQGLAHLKRSMACFSQTSDDAPRQSRSRYDDDRPLGTWDF